MLDTAPVVALADRFASCRRVARERANQHTEPAPRKATTRNADICEIDLLREQIGFDSLTVFVYEREEADDSPGWMP